MCMYVRRPAAAVLAISVLASSVECILRIIMFICKLLAASRPRVIDSGVRAYRCVQSLVIEESIVQDVFRSPPVSAGLYSHLLVLAVDDISGKRVDLAVLGVVPHAARLGCELRA